MIVQEFSEKNLESTKGILLYGAGAWGKLVYETLQSWILNSNVQKYKEIPIIFVDRLKSDFKGVKIIRKSEIADYPEYDILICAPSAYDEIIKDVERWGGGMSRHIFGIGEIIKKPCPKTQVNVHDWLSGELLLEKYDYFRKRNEMGRQIHKNGDFEIVMPFLCISVTERCSLNCQGCIAMVPHYENPVNYKFEDMKDALDQLINSVDRILELGFVGGEVFMNKEFYRYVEWALNEEKVRTINILTNGTILPDQRMVELLKKEKVLFGIDDYGTLSKRKQELIEMSKKENIKYYVLRNEFWQDLGSFNRKNYSKEKKDEIFRNCSFKDCCIFLNGKVYRCQYEAHLANLGVCAGAKEDSLDLTVQRNVEICREKLTELLLKDTALEACSFCNDNTEQVYRIPAARQAGSRKAVNSVE